MPFTINALLPAIRRSQFFNETDVVMEPLQGYVDGARRTFTTYAKPLVVDPSGLYGPPAPLVIYDQHENEVDSQLYALLSAKAGGIQFVKAPTLVSRPLAPFKASYTAADLDLASLWAAARSGFDEMESRFSRGFRLVDTGSPSPIPGQNDLAIVDVNGSDPTGPGATTFSTSAIQLDFLGACAIYRLNRDYFGMAARSAYRYRESRQGMEVDPTAALKAQEAHLKMLMSSINDVADRARSEWDSSNNGLGGAIPNPMSSGYANLFSWAPYCGPSASQYGGAIPT